MQVALQPKQSANVQTVACKMVATATERCKPQTKRVVAVCYQLHKKNKGIACVAVPFFVKRKIVFRSFCSVKLVCY